jgi:hypothetical protein
MSQHEAFLKAIRVEPNDSFHERIYRDYLEEQGYDPPEPYLATARLLADHLHSARQVLSIGRHDRIGKFGAEVIVGCTRLDALREIYIPGRVVKWSSLNTASRRPVEVEPNLGEDGAITLVNSPLMEQIRTLDLRYNHLGERAVETLLRAPYLDGLERLDLDEPDQFLTPEHFDQLEQHFAGALRRPR